MTNAPAKPPFDPALLLLSVAQAIHRVAAGDDESWDALTDDEQGQFTLAAHAAIAAHDRWLQQAQFRIVPPGMIAPPQSKDEATAMLMTAKTWLDKDARRPQTPGLVMPPKPRLRSLN